MVQDNGTNAPINYSRPPTKPKCNNPLLVLATTTTTGSNATIKSGRILTTKPTATTTEPSDGDDDTTPTNMTTDTTNYTTNWFWPRVACMSLQQSTHRFGRTKQSGATTMTMAPKATINFSLSLVLSVLRFYNKHYDHRLVSAERDNPVPRQRQQTQQPTPSETITYTNDNKQQWW